MSIEENKKAARRFNEEPWNENKLAVLDELTAPAYRLNGSGGIEALITIYHFANGKIVDDRYESSGPSLYDQLLGA